MIARKPFTSIRLAVMKYYGLDWIGTVTGLASIYYIGRQNRLALVLRIVASIFWVGFGVVAGTLPGVIANLAAILLCLRGVAASKGQAEE
jgi:hypothetical protein